MNSESKEFNFYDAVLKQEYSQGLHLQQYDDLNNRNGSKKTILRTSESCYVFGNFIGLNQKKAEFLIN